MGRARGVGVGGRAEGPHNTKKRPGQFSQVAPWLMPFRAHMGHVLLFAWPHAIALLSCPIAPKFADIQPFDQPMRSCKLLAAGPLAVDKLAGCLLHSAVFRL